MYNFVLGVAATLGSSSASSSSGGGAHVFTEEALSESQVPLPAVDEAAPTTTLQVRAVNGKKIKIR